MYVTMNFHIMYIALMVFFICNRLIKNWNYLPDSDELAHSEVVWFCTDHQGVIDALQVQINKKYIF